MAGACCPTPTSRWSSACPASASTRRTTAPSPGRTCCSRPANGKAAASASPTRWTAIARWPTTRSRRRPQGRCAAAAGAGYVLGIQRRAHQPAVAGAAAPVRRAAARGLSRGADAAARAPATAGAGTATTMPGSSCRRRAACSRCPVARTGAAACRSARATRRASASCCSTAGATATSHSFPKPGCASCPNPARSRLSTAAAVAQPRWPQLPGRVHRQRLHGGCRRASSLDRAGS